MWIPTYKGDKLMMMLDRLDWPKGWWSKMKSSKLWMATPEAMDQAAAAAAAAVPTINKLVVSEEKELLLAGMSFGKLALNS